MRLLLAVPTLCWGWGASVLPTGGLRVPRPRARRAPCGLPGVGAVQLDYPLVNVLPGCLKNHQLYLILRGMWADSVSSPVHIDLRPGGRGAVNGGGGGGGVSTRREAREGRHRDGGRGALPDISLGAHFL